MANRFQTNNGTTPSQPSCFTEEILQLFGDDFDPDPLFLEESWTLGIPAAAENLHRRRQNLSDRERQNSAVSEFNNLGSLLPIESLDRTAESLLADRAYVVASRHVSTWSQCSAPTNAAPSRDIQQSWSPADWSPDDQIAHSWIPQGWMPEGMPPQKGPLQEAKSVAEPRDKMTAGGAHQLLGTTTASTREQIRSGYRRRVSEWHPDRLQFASDAAREFATQQMAAINEAYHLLRTSLL